MKKNIGLLLGAVLFWAIGTAFAGIATENLNTISLDKFDQVWNHTGSANLNPEATKIQIVDAGANNTGLYPAAEKDSKSMGVKTGFYTKGYNTLTLTPPKGALKLPGKAKKIQIWVLGMKYRYSLVAYLQDFRGMVHKVDFGSLFFEGWKSMSVDIPNWIPQQDEGFPRDRPLKLLKLMLVADPMEQSDRFYIYFNSIKIVTDIYQETFDGVDLINKTTW